MATEPRLLTSDVPCFARIRAAERAAPAYRVCRGQCRGIPSGASAPALPRTTIEGPTIIMYAPLEGFMGYVTVSMTTSLCLLAPLLLYEVNRLLRAVCGLPPRLALWSTVAAGSLFALGAGFCYVVILPVTLRFLLSFGGENVEAGISVSRYLSMSLGLSAACGVTFELPLVTLILHRLGFLSVCFLTEHRRYAVLLGAIFTAIITPTPDAFTMSTLLLPLLALYEMSIVLMRLAERRQKTSVTHVAKR